ncbi:MAG: TIGR03619 family F420-dependent LLM class oxidoreductase, partial [Actinobacteria bacterium]|nr:TIGR03619 family F420-dependent LLM class oxidoreductase [Actinomycetota bacterium]
DAGYASMVVPDSICYPRHSASVYPFNPDGSREFLEDKPFIDPFILITALAAVTTTLRFPTFVVKLPIRHPVLVAKQVGSVAAMTNNRLWLGVGTSPWPEDYDVTDVAWAGRGRRMDEMLDIIKGLLTGDFFEYHGKVFDLQSVKMTPAPTKPVPILIGGHGEAALKRAARIGDGWMHGGGGPEGDLPTLLARIGELREEFGRAHQPFEVHAISMEAYTVDGVQKLEEQGVTDAIVGFRWPYTVGPDTEPLQAKLDAIARYGEDVIAASRH